MRTRSRLDPMRRRLQDGLLFAYRVVFANGLMRYRWGQRVFFALYDTYKRLFEAGEIAQLQAYAPPGSMLIDVGANIGFFTLRFAQWVGPQGRVIAIEPEAENFAELVRRILHQKLADRVATYHAVADRVAGKVRLVVNRNHPGDHRIGSEGVEVHAVTLDDVTAAEDRVIALIKIDVQGAEMRVLAGAESVLTQHRPALFVEVDPNTLARFGASVDALLAFLSPFGYVPHALKHDGARIMTRGDLDAQIGRRGFVDVLFIATTR